MFGPAKPHVESQRPNKTKSTSLWSLMSSLRDASEKNAAVPPHPVARPDWDNAPVWEPKAPQGRRGTPARRPGGGVCLEQSERRPSRPASEKPCDRTHLFSHFSPPTRHAVVSNANKLRTFEVLSLTRLNLLFSACVSF